MLVSTPGLLALAVVAFVVELALFGGVGAIAFRAAGGGWAGWLAAIAPRPDSSWLVWGHFVAPKVSVPARHRRPCPASRRRPMRGHGLRARQPRAGRAGDGSSGVAGLAVVAAQVVLPTAPHETA